VSRVQTVVIPELEVGGKKVRDINAPALREQHLGAEGMLGVDSLQSQRVSFNFPRQEMTIVPSQRREERWPSDVIVVTARNRFGHLVLVDAAVEGQKVWVIIDTGSEVSVGNNALRRRLGKRRLLRTVVPIQLFSVTGGQMTAEATRVKEIRIAGINIHDLPIAFADVHPFRKLDLLDRPALLLGMDALRLFERVSVDFANRKVKLLPAGSSGLPPTGRLVMAERTKPGG
jgi:predicted aspartyl protease